MGNNVVRFVSYPIVLHWGGGFRVMVTLWDEEQISTDAGTLSATLKRSNQPFIDQMVMVK